MVGRTRGINESGIESTSCRIIFGNILKQLPHRRTLLPSREAEPQGADINSLTHPCYQTCLAKIRPSLNHVRHVDFKPSMFRTGREPLLTEPMMSLPPSRDPLRNSVQGVCKADKHHESSNSAGWCHARSCHLKAVVGQRRSVSLNWMKVS